MHGAKLVGFVRNESLHGRTEKRRPSDASRRPHARAGNPFYDMDDSWNEPQTLLNGPLSGRWRLGDKTSDALFVRPIYWRRLLIATGFFSETG